VDIAFWQGFLILSVIAGLFVLWPTVVVRRDRKSELQTDARTDANELLYKSQLKELEDTHASGEIAADEMAALRRDLEQTHTSDLQVEGLQTDKPIVANFKSRLPVLGLVLALPLLTFLIYQKLGAKQDWEIYQNALGRVHVKTMDERKERNEALVEQLQQRLQKKPDNVQNWYLLATTALELGDHEEAVRAYGKILEQQPDAAKVRAEYAQALFLRAGKTVTPEVRENTQKALQIAPNLPTALGLAGIDAFQSGSYQLAIDSWQLAMSQLDPNARSAKVLADGIARAQIAMRQSGQTGSESDKKEAQEKADIQLKVSVSVDEKAVTADPENHVFIYARAWQGPKMPLAIQRLKVSDLPKKLTLDQSMSMAPGMDLSSFPQVELVARISKSGSAIPESGDWQVTAGPIIIAEQKKTVKLVVKEQLP